ncbi:probable F-box protein At4g22030 [Cynara cardunculus var. scolymus]|uniref:probable F-box protein At4g22030 n=1 Tax=Cynara cardunculus var. scolymus TaxID=59895 RepID=UPI000D6232C9|nr:probable F-box protein At4g22030 [Cynara cardunculus var. scolymus]
MAAINQASSFMCSTPTSFPSNSSSRRDNTRAGLNFPKIRISNPSIIAPKIVSNIGLVEEMDKFSRFIPKNPSKSPKVCRDREVMEKLYVILEAVLDRVEMHKNVGEQRNDWNSLLLTSINTITLSAATMAGIAAAVATTPGAPMEVLKLSSSFMYLAATGLLVIMNKIQPSQLVEEQRNAARLFKQLESEIRTKIAIGNPTLGDVNEAMKKVLAIDRAYPLPLLGVMLEKFPAKVEPAVWWPEKRRTSANKHQNDKNGWSVELEEEMRDIIRVLEVKDKDDYLRLGKKALKLNKALAIAGPLLTGLGAIGSAFLGSSPHDSWAVVLGIMAGAMASVANTVEHGGQVGMVFEMYRSNAGFFKMMEESIESNLKERNEESRENGEVFEMKVALQLGRSLSELRDVAASSSKKGKDIEEFGSKLF